MVRARSSFRRPFRATILIALVLVLSLATVAGAHVAPWQLRNAYWAPAPADLAGHLFALRVETNGPPVVTGSAGSISFSPPAGTTVATLGALSLDAYYESGGCGGGSPRYQLRIDADGNGAFSTASGDFYVQAYAGPFPGFTGCPLGSWEHHDLLADPGARWFVPGAGYLTYAASSAYLTAGYPAYQVFRVDLQWDSTWLFGPSVTWFDNLRIGDHSLSEPAGGDLWCPLLADGTGACPFVILP